MNGTTAPSKPRTTNGGRLEHYEVKASRGLGSLNWPTGFSGTGWALLDAPGGNVVSRYAFRFDAIKALIELDGLDPATFDTLASDTAHVAASVCPEECDGAPEDAPTPACRCTTGGPVCPDCPYSDGKGIENADGTVATIDELDLTDDERRDLTGGQA